VLKRATVLEMPTLIPRVFSGRPTSVLRHRQVQGFEPLERFRVTTLDERPFPLQVDGDFVGEFSEAEYEAAPASLTVVS
jgi:diacylglycerol kinase family enzyme